MATTQSQGPREGAPGDRSVPAIFGLAQVGPATGQVPTGIKRELPRGTPHEPRQFDLVQLQPTYYASALGNVATSGGTDFLLAVLDLSGRRCRSADRGRFDSTDNVGLAPQPG